MERLTLEEAIKHANQVAMDKSSEMAEKIIGMIDVSSCKKCMEEHEQLAEWLEELKEYKGLEKQGKLLKLPCAVGDIIWDIDFGRPCGYEVTGFSFGSLNDDDWEEEKVLDKVVVYYTNSNGSITETFAVSEIGKSVFLTREEAEAALKEMSE